MYNNLPRGSVPLPGHASGMGVLPEYFHKHDIIVTYEDGKEGKSCHVSTNGQYFSLETLIGQPFTWNSIILEQVSYVDQNGDTQFYDLPDAEPVNMLEDPTFTLGAVSKFNGLRWGFNFHFDKKTGRGQLVTDPGSPIVGVFFRFVNT